MSRPRRAMRTSWRSTSIRRSSGKSTTDSVYRSSKDCESWRTRSTMRASRVEVEKISVPQAEMSTAGVIIAESRLRSAEASDTARLSRSLPPEQGADDPVHEHHHQGPQDPGHEQI